MAFRRKRRDFFKSSVEERRRTEDERPWFLDGDEGELDIEAGRSADDGGLRAATEEDRSEG